MSEFIIQGGNTLHGNIKVAGFKNAATPIIAASILTKEEIILHNVPLIEDVKKMLQIIVSMGAKVNWLDKNSVKIDNSQLNPDKIDMTVVSCLRSSILLMGALLARFGKVRIKEPGGCQIGARSMDVHFRALEQLGVEIKSDDNQYILKKVKPAQEEIVMTEISVTATENIILAAALNQGTVSIRLAASEPHVQDLCWFLESLGVEIKGIGSHDLIIKGATILHGGEYTIIPDLIETGTFISLAGATRSKITIENTAPQFIALELEKYKEVGLKLEIEYLNQDPQGHYKLANIKVDGKVNLKAIKKLHDMPYPGFAADLIQPFAVLMTQAKGTSLIHDWMYDGRLKYISELKKMGANIVVSDPHRVVVIGPSPLFGKEINSFDLRAGATLIIAALAASGTSTVTNIYQVDRGYEQLDLRLANLGARIKRINDQ
ncbi:MAG: UDP-N-acetylglucosamine 1-carboxyvinyltransferase [Candidatus Komeilibacteria bacterium CG11_big_fil_rev_8_21_14_0_20_36_20]|uniref:UDP-N-acetylglucosamine 1-carboxyvinyltransferase n=1 Tax=Candidatus Komeilibacteria bacterium CG11_big_fil_rev_8_21_14_0_20_36_20 TaxID=1974477 RepID=A0A2H0NE00_9BACT|nr:MAG: UDP-N-acetylglucosamine 1-carboxyvinyltransferase [Candidatus Komeilibacteria bacterium CG11_big_fil_rev_8_21_14_0_20_36_20]PIR81438.1 MAG: UDP-N-acetylglucosamine 1-carboxyvinyltransferase [Candidatus Komeilibacteria bacterium CG10_big_fil_rev_8_21_14_0_10_36_65]PJC55639.1 MAG: UDP-N-acetylglucosamine 1-carboxyvinyltransferase [Candidatus Komeilibacteria bacterium CG_4_9_14_0_2_um_filter_36_13]